MSKQRPRMHQVIAPGTDAIVTAAKRVFGFKGPMAEIRKGACNDELRQAIIICALRAGHSLTHVAAVIGYDNTRLIAPYVGIRVCGAMSAILEEIQDQAMADEGAEKHNAVSDDPSDMVQMRESIRAGDTKLARLLSRIM